LFVLTTQRYDESLAVSYALRLSSLICEISHYFHSFNLQSCRSLPRARQARLHAAISIWNVQSRPLKKREIFMRGDEGKCCFLQYDQSHYWLCIEIVRTSFPRPNQHCLTSHDLLLWSSKQLENLTGAYMTSITSGHFRSWSHQACFLSSRVTTFIVPRICLRALAVTEVRHRNKCFQFICHPQSISTYPHKRRGDFGETFETKRHLRRAWCAVCLSCGALGWPSLMCRGHAVVVCWTKSWLLR